jgi:hypothetical protein
MDPSEKVLKQEKGTLKLKAILSKGFIQFIHATLSVFNKNTSTFCMGP